MIQRFFPVRASLALAAACACVPALATDLGVSLELGTTGVGVHLSTPIAPQLDLRVGGNFLDYKHNTSTRGVDYDAKLRLQTFDLLLDYFPQANSVFRVSGGLVIDNNRLDATGQPQGAGTYTLNGTTYTLGSLSGRATFRSPSPYLGIGWGRATSARKGWSLTSDLGVIFQGNARTSLTANGCSPAAACSTLASDLAAENQSLQDKLHNLRYFPVIRVGASYSF